MKKMTQLEICRKALESASEVLESIKANDKTVYNYKGDGAKNRDGLILEECRWATPREIAEAGLKLIQTALSAQGEQGMDHRPQEQEGTPRDFTPEEALAEARKRWGPDAWLTVHTSGNEPWYLLGHHGGYPMYQLGTGKSFRAAFADAEAKKITPTPTAQEPPTETQERCPE